MNNMQGSLLTECQLPSYYPLSSTQKRLYFLHAFSEDTTAYNLAISAKIQGKIDPGKLEDALNKLINRHSILRTSFKEVEGDIVQCVQEKLEIKLDVLEGNPKNIQPLFEEFIQPFDLASLPLIRSSLIILSPNEQIFFLDLPHLIADGKSMSIFLNELAQLYQGLELPSIKTEYKDYAIWQNNALTSEAFSKQKNYWTNQFHDDIAALNLPIRKSTQQIRTNTSELMKFSFEGGVLENIKSLAARCKVSSYIFFMAVYQVFLSKICNNTKIIVGSSVEGRLTLESKTLLGAFINTLPIRGNLLPTKKFNTFLDEIKATCIDAIENQAYPFDELVAFLSNKLKTKEGFQIETFFDFHQDRILQLNFGHLQIEIIPLRPKEAKFDLSLEVIDKGNLYECYFEYRQQLFESHQIHRFIQYFRQIIATIIENPEQTLNSIDPLSAEEKIHQKQIFNSLHSESSNKLFLDYFKQQYIQKPDAIAICSGNRQLTYAQLEEKSSHLAKHLICLGIEEDDSVAFFMDRDIEFLISMLAVFKAQAAYVPLDPKAPIKRTLSLIESSRAKLTLMTQRTYWESDSSYDVNHLLRQPSPQNELVLDISPNHISYVIFTSGSTGTPKGVMVEHLGMCNHLLAKIEDFGISQQDVIAQTSSQTFDVSVWQFLVALMVGARVCIFADEKAWDTAPLFEELERSHVTVFETVPSHMTLLIEELEIRGEQRPHFKALKFLILNGEPLSLPMAKLWQALYPQKPLANVYGPTECSDDVTHYIVPPNPSEKNLSIPIGNIIRNLQGYILDEYASMLPIGTQGELCIGGVGLARGYHNQPDKTAVAFIPNPFLMQKGNITRLYRTGDLSYYQENGILEHLGRIDHQIKINGQRIELGEIEAAIASHSDVAQNVVVLKGKNYLVGYVLLRKSCELETIRKYLETKLPSYMIPSLLMIVESFPVLPSGKVDRKSLPEPQYTAKNIELPANPIESQLKDLWSSLLKVENLSTLDNFFRMGGHSLLATQLIARVLKIFGVKLSIKTIYQFQTIVELAREITRLLKQETESIHVPFPTIVPDREGQEKPFPLTEIQQAYWIGRKGIFTLGEVSVHVYAEYDCPQLDCQQLENAWNIMIRRHGALRLIFTEDGMQKILENVPRYSINYTDLSLNTVEEIGSELQKFRTLHSHEVFDSTQWPLFALRAVKLKNTIRLYISFDALIIDGWSVDLIFSEWVKVYKNKNANLEPLQISFRDYVLAQNKLREHPLFLIHKKYWINRIDEFPPPPALPLAQKPEQISEQKFSRCSKRISKEKWSKVQALIQPKELSPTGFLTFLFSEILYLYSGSEHFVINLTLFNRPALHDQIDQIAGDFTSLTLLEIRHHGSSTFEKRAQEVQKQLWQDLDHHLFNGVEFIREISRVRAERGESIEFPVVLTSVLGLDDQQNFDLEEIFGTEVYSITQTPQVWLDFKAYEIKGELIIEWDYVTELFSQGFIESMHGSFCELLDTFASNAAIWEKPFINLLAAKQVECRAAYNQTKESCNAIVLDQAISSHGDDDIAVIDPKGQISYKMLKITSSSIAHQVKNRSLHSNKLVAIIMDKGWEQVAAAIGIMEAGRAYLPIDPSHPPARIAALVDQGQPHTILTQPHLVAKLSNIPALQNKKKYQLLVIDPDNIPINLQEPIHQRSVSDLAYVIFTSGSTGTPKGVMIEHRSAYNTIRDINKRFKVGPSDKILSLSNLNFDLSVYDIFGILNAAGTIVFPEPEKYKDPVHWAELLTYHQITIWNTVPMFMQILIEYLEAHDSKWKCLMEKTLRLILLSGDWIPTDLPQRIASFFPHAKIVSLGGATEASIWSILFEIDGSKKYEKSIPYGYPMANQTFHILNQQGLIVPDFVPGKLFIGGMGVARGYWNDEVKTSNAFIMHPEYGRIYDTGDIGRFNPAHGIEFLGRKDTQIKIRGHRIELGEIDAILLQHPFVVQSQVLTIKDTPLSQRLVACVVPKQSSDDETIPEGIILDQLERKQFTLMQNGIDPIPPKACRIQLQKDTPLDIHNRPIRKSYRQFLGVRMHKEHFLHWITESFKNLDWKTSSPKQLTKEHLSCLLGKLCQLNPSISLPKYLYPSAGSLYPVQTFVITPNLEQIPSGSYYHHPQTHELIRISDATSQSMQLCFRGKKSAIDPLYGPLSDSLCAIETGYMLRLVKNEADRLQIPHQFDFSNDSFCSINFGQTTSLFPPELAIYFYIKKDQIQSMEGWYTYSSYKAKLEKVFRSVPFQVLPELEDVYSILENAAGAIFFVKPNQSEENSQVFSVLSGFFGQELMDLGYQYNIGLCPMGKIDQFSKHILDQVTDHAAVVHYMLFGPVSKEQQRDTNPSVYQSDAFCLSLKKFAREHLPEYMIPQVIKTITSMPLTSNGKVDNQRIAELFSIDQQEEAPILLPQNKTEQKLWDIWSLLLETQNFGIHDSFFELGGNSLLLTRMSLEVRKIFALDLPLQIFFQNATIASLAKRIMENEPPLAVEQFEFSEDIKVDPAISFAPSSHHQNSHVFLTGSTGFLGAYLLNELLQRTAGNVFCLVRASTKAEALGRIIKNGNRFGLSYESNLARISPIIGDLSKEKLGCSLEDWEILETTPGKVIHNGAFVHHIFDYSTLRNANVRSTHELLKLTQKNPKTLIYISSLLSIIDRKPTGELIEGFPTGQIEGLYSGYQKTKWANEMLLKSSHEKGLETVVIRPNTISGGTATGKCSYKNDHFLRLIKGCIQMRMAPIWEEVIDLLPVDFVSRAIIEIMHHGKFPIPVYNLTSSQHYTWLQLIEWIQKRGYPIELVPAFDWSNKYLPHIESNNALFPLIPLYIASENAHADQRAEKMIACNSQAETILQSQSLSIPYITESYLTKLFEFLEHENFLIGVKV